MRYEGILNQRLFWRRVDAYISRRTSWCLRGARILLYHRVSDSECDPQYLNVSVHRFEQQMELLSATHSVVPLSEIATRVRRKQSINGLAAVTFDDGYLDNLTYAKPILERHGIPATVFVSSGFCGNARTYYWDELATIEKALKANDVKAVSLDLGQRKFEWVLRQDGPAARRVNISDQLGLQAEVSYYKLCDYIKRLESEARDEAVRYIRSVAEREYGVVTPAQEYKTMSGSELQHLSRGGLIRIGAHTVNHVALGLCEASVQEKEIRDSKFALESLLGEEVEALSYPYGSVWDYTMDTVAITRRAGFRLSCANNASKVTPRSNLWELPRVLVRNWAVEDFDRALAKV